MDTLPVINQTYDLYKRLIEMDTHLEKRWRYSLGTSLEQTVLQLMGELIMAKHAPKTLKATYLIRACAFQEIAVLKLCLFLELKIANETKISQSQAVLSEIGRMLGGWLKSLGAS
jgi:hypothetical protein